MPNGKVRDCEEISGEVTYQWKFFAYRFV